MDRSGRILIAWLLMVFGCAGTEDPDADQFRATLLALSTYEVVVGQPVIVYGIGFQNRYDTRTNLRWIGQFRPAGGGEPLPVDVTMYTDFLDGNAVSIPYFGPFGNPFAPTGDEIGVFEGEVHSLVMREGADSVEGPGFPVKFTVNPSIVITDLQPVNARCSAPAKRLIGGVPYKVSVKAVGFRPVNFTYSMLSQPDSGNNLRVRHPAQSFSDQLGGSHIFILDDIPSGAYRTKGVLVVSAYDEGGIEHSLALPISIHRPIEVIYSGRADVAQIYAATPMSGCLTGSGTGTSYTYSEGTSETRTRSLGVTWDQGWQESHSTTNGTSRTETNGTLITKFDLNTNIKGQYGELGGEFSIGGGDLIPVGFKVNGKGGWSNMDARMTGTTVGQDHSVSDTVSRSETDTTGHSISEGGADFYTISSSDVKLNSFTTTIFPGMYGVSYRQTTRLSLPATIVSYNLCGEPSVAGNVALTDWVWSVDLGQGASCPPFPAPTLPQPQCVIGPCD